MSKTKEIVDRRRHTRFWVPKYAFAALAPDYTKVGQITNLSIGGLAFRYLDSGGPSKPLELDIFLAGRTFFLYKLPFEFVWELRTDEVHFNSTVTKMTGLQFGDLTPHQISELNSFIHRYALGEVDPKS